MRLSTDPDPARDAIPLTVLTGFLGSGKTTLLVRLLADPDLRDTAVLVNEFGEVGLDHLLVRHVAEDVVLLGSGCVCCSVRGDMVNALRDLFLRRVHGTVPDFRRLVIETSGLADPAPIVHTLIRDPLAGARYRLDGIVTTVDAVHIEAQLAAHPEPAKQIALADRLVLTKTDLARDAGALRAVHARLARINPAAPVLDAMARPGPAELFDAGLFTGTGAPDPRRWLAAEAHEAGAHGPDCPADCGHDHGGGHDRRIASFVLSYDRPLKWASVASALEELAAVHGERLLRVKGILALDGSSVPVAIHAVQHLFHPPAPLPGWPDDDHRSRLVFITRDLPREAVEAILRPGIFYTGSE